MSYANEKAELLKMVDLYCQSVNNADNTALAEQVWATGPESSLTHPRGHEFGWEQIKQNFYTNIMANMFSKRELKLGVKPVINIYGNAAVVEFFWDFTATVKEDGSERKTRGRESQVFVKMPDSGWRIVHVHYSGVPEKA